MIKYREYDKGKYTGYYTYANSDQCIQKYKHILHNSSGLSTRLSDTTVYTYSQSDLPACMSISNENTFNTCLNSCISNNKKICNAYLEKTTITLVENQYGSSFDKLEVKIMPTKPQSIFSTDIINNDNIRPSLELSGVAIKFNSLDISGVNLNVHDVSDISLSPIDISLLTIQGGSHNFYKNHSNSPGGVIYSTDTIEFIDASMSFISNNSKYDGGAIRTVNLNVSGSKTNLQFMNNWANGNKIENIPQEWSSGAVGGAISSLSGCIINTQGIGQINFSGNHTLQSSPALGGGAIYSQKTINITDTSITFNGNYTNPWQQGGAIYTAHLTISGNKTKAYFIDNSSFIGGAIRCFPRVSGDWFKHGSQASINFIDASLTFSDNKALNYGGAIAIGSDEETPGADLYHCNFINATTTFKNNYSIDNGGALYVKYLTISGNKTKSYFIGNSGGNLGGAIFADHPIIFMDVSISFKSNYAETDGGAIWGTFVPGLDTVTISFIDASMSFISNQSNNNGGAIVADGNLTISGGSNTFTNNRTISGNGGAIYVTSDYLTSHLISSDSNNTFTNNRTISGDGGAIYVMGNLTSSGGSNTFTNNRTISGDGGAIYSTIDISFIDASMSFKNNYSNNDGGAIYVMRNLISSSSNITFTNNYSISGYGGAIYQKSGYIEFNAGIYEFSYNMVKNSMRYGSAIGGDNIYVSEPNKKTTLNFTNNQGSHTIWVNSFDTSSACPSASSFQGCLNNYKFYQNNTDNHGIIGFSNSFYIAGGFWDFSSNKINGKDSTAIYGIGGNSAIIHIRYADISFGNMLETFNTTADVSNIGNTDPHTYKYYTYTLYGTTSFSGDAAHEISRNRYIS